MLVLWINPQLAEVIWTSKLRDCRANHQLITLSALSRVSASVRYQGLMTRASMLGIFESARTLYGQLHAICRWLLVWHNLTLVSAHLSMFEVFHAHPCHYHPDPGHDAC